MSDLTNLLQAAAQDQPLITTLHRQLYRPTFKGFDVPVEAWHDGGYDGWFHPSGQSLFSMRQLYLYRTRQDVFEHERMPLTGVLAVTAGTFWHRFVQMVLLDDGKLVQDEVPVQDEYTHRRGHADGLLDNGEGLEIKTINGFQITKIVNETILKQKKPGYWAQAQDYMDCLGLKVMRFLLISPSYPYEMSEFTVAADFDYIAKRRVEYHQAYELSLKDPTGSLAEDLSPDAPLPRCCEPLSAKSKSCPVRLACPVGSFRG